MIDGKPVALTRWQLEKVEEHTARTYRESQAFSSVTVGGDPPPDALRAEVHFHHTASDLFGWTMATYLTFFLLPVSFFTFPIPVYWWALDDLNRSTLAEAQSNGIF